MTMNRMIELRFVERISSDGHRSQSVVKVLQYREGAMYPWRDVPVYTIDQQEAADREADSDASGPAFSD